MKPEEIKVGTTFKYMGYTCVKEKNLIQVVDKIEGNHIISRFQNNELPDNRIHIDSVYRMECETINMPTSQTKFSVHSYSLLDKSNKVSHWSDGLNMIITKDNVTIELTEDEIRQLVATLPRTFGGSY